MIPFELQTITYKRVKNPMRYLQIQEQDESY